LWEGNWSPVSQEIPRFSLTPNLHYSSPSLFPLLSPTETVQDISVSFLKINFNIILQSNPKTTKIMSTVRSPIKLSGIFSSPQFASHTPPNRFFFDFVIPIIFYEVPLYAIFSIPRYYLPRRPTHVAQRLVLSPSMCFYPNVRHHISHLCKKITNYQLRPITFFRFTYKFCDTNLQSFVIYHMRAVLPAPPNRSYFHFFSRVQTKTRHYIMNSVMCAVLVRFSITVVGQTLLFSYHAPIRPTFKPKPVNRQRV